MSKRAKTHWSTSARLIVTVEDDEERNPRVTAIHILPAGADLRFYEAPDDDDVMDATIDRHGKAVNDAEEIWQPLADLPISVVWEP